MSHNLITRSSHGMLLRSPHGVRGAAGVTAARTVSKFSSGWDLLWGADPLPWYVGRFYGGERDWWHESMGIHLRLHYGEDQVVAFQRRSIGASWPWAVLDTETGEVLSINDDFITCGDIRLDNDGYLYAHVANALYKYGNPPTSALWVKTVPGGSYDNPFAITPSGDSYLVNFISGAGNIGADEITASGVVTSPKWVTSGVARYAASGPGGMFMAGYSHVIGFNAGGATFSTALANWNSQAPIYIPVSDVNGNVYVLGTLDSPLWDLAICSLNASGVERWRTPIGSMDVNGLSGWHGPTAICVAGSSVIAIGTELDGANCWTLNASTGAIASSRLVDVGGDVFSIEAMSSGEFLVSHDRTL